MIAFGLGVEKEKIMRIRKERGRVWCFAWVVLELIVRSHSFTFSAPLGSVPDCVS